MVEEERGPKVLKSKGQEVQASQGRTVPRSQGPTYLRVTFKYELDSKEGPSCFVIFSQNQVFKKNSIFRVHFCKFLLRGPKHLSSVTLCHIQKKNLSTAKKVTSFAQLLSSHCFRAHLKGTGKRFPKWYDNRNRSKK